MSLQYKPVALETFVEKAMTDYGEYVVYSRAIPKIEDGLKPVQRRVLWSMYQLGLKPGAGTTKCARIVGDTIGKYHPHGDSSTYQSLVSMATPWTCKHPLVKAQGNFGSLMGDSAAAYRYTEAGFTEVGYSLFEDEKYLDYQDNYDGMHKEPVALGSPFPMFLTHGYEGIALGFAGAVPAHDIKETIRICLENLKGKRTTFLTPQLEQKSYLLNSEEEIQLLYSTGEGTLNFCSHYEIDDKKHKIIVRGFAPGVSMESIATKLKELIAKELITIEDSSGEAVELEITVKDTRLFKDKILSALKGSKHYSFYAICGDKIRLLNLDGIFDQWKSYRFTLLGRKIDDHKVKISREIKEVLTMILLIENRDKFREAIDQEDMKSAKAVLATFIDEDMHDFVMKLQVSQVMRMNLKKLQDKVKELNKKLKYWNTTTPAKELQIQLEELLMELPDVESLITLKREKDLPDFTRTAEVSSWFSIYGDRIEVSQDTPTRGRGFGGTSMAECNSYCTIVNRQGGLESYPIHSIPKKYYFEDRKLKPLAVIPDCGGLVVYKTNDGCMFVRSNEEVKGYKEITSDNKQFEKVLVLQPGESLVLKFKQGRPKILTYDQVEKRSAQKSIKSSIEMRGFQNPLVDIVVANPELLTRTGRVNPEKWKDEEAFNVGKKNFVILVGGQRQILSRAQVVEVLAQVEQVHRIL